MIGMAAKIIQLFPAISPPPEGKIRLFRGSKEYAAWRQWVLDNQESAIVRLHFASMIAGEPRWFHFPSPTPPGIEFSKNGNMAA